MNILTKEMRRTLKELDLGLKGELTITNDMEDLGNSLFFDQVCLIIMENISTYIYTLFSPLKYPLTNRYPSSNNVLPSVEKILD